MADTIARLRLNSDDFDSKIKRAVTGLQQMEDECRKVGGTLAILEKDQLDYVKALGQMQTVATTTKGKLAELTNAYTELRVQYNRLTDEEKKGDFGKALSSSLDQLKTRIESTRNELSNIGKELGNTNGAGQQSTSMLDQLAQRFTINIDAVKLFQMGLKAANVALDVAKDAFFASESNIDEWGRTVEGAKGAYNVFLDTLNNGNWSNFFQNITKAIEGARDLYDSLDRLSSVKANNQAAIALVQAQIQQLRVMKQQGKDVDEQIRQATQRLKQLQGQSVTAGKKAGKDDVVNTLSNYFNSHDVGNVGISQKTLELAADRIMKEGQAYFDGMRKVVSSYENNSKYQTRTQKYDPLTKTYKDVDQFDITKLNEQQQRQYVLAKAITEKETELQRGISTYAQAVNESASAFREEFRGNRYSKQGAGGSSSSPKDTAAKAVQDAELAYSQTIEKARMAVENGTATEAETKKKTLAAEESLWTAYGKAYATYSDPKYKEAQDAAAGRIKELGGEVEKLLETQKAAQQAARELEAAQKKLAEADDKMAVALSNNDLKAYNAAKRQAATAQAEVERIQKVVTVAVEAGKENLPDVPKEITQRVNVETGEISLPEIPADVKQTVNVETGEIDIPELPAYMEIKANVKPGTTELPALPESEDVPVNFTLTGDNLNAFISDLKTRIGDSEVGTTLYNNLTAQLADAQMLGDFISIALKNGVDLAEFDVQGLFAKIFGDGTEAGDYIKDVVWEQMIAALEEQTGKKFSADMNEGKIAEDKGDGNNGMETAQKTVSAIASLASGFQQMGVTLPKEVTGVINAVQGLITVIQAANTLIHLFNTGTSVSQIATTTSNTIAVGALTASIGGLIASINTNTFSHFLFAGGGIVPHAASGFIIPGNDHADMTPIFAQSGELILNKAQQGVIANELQASEGGGQAVGAPYATGETIFLGVNNYLRRAGYGEIVTTGG